MAISRKNVLILITTVAVIVAAGIIGFKTWRVHNAMDRLYDISFGQYQGPVDAPKTIIEFVDYRCHACRAIHPVMIEVLRRNPDVRIIYRHYPIFEKPSVIEAEVALAAGMHGKFEEAHNYLMSREEPITDREIDELASRLGINVGQFRYDMKGQKMGLLLIETLDMFNTLGVKSTPTFFVNGIKLTTESGMPTPETFEKLLAEAYGE